MNSTTKKIVTGAIALALPLSAAHFAPQASAQENVNTNSTTEADEYLNVAGIDIPDGAIDMGKELLGKAIGGGGLGGLLGGGSGSDSSTSTSPNTDTTGTGSTSTGSDTSTDTGSTPDTDTIPISDTQPTPTTSATKSSSDDKSADEQKTVNVKVHATGDKEDVKFVLLSDGEEVDSATTDEKGNAELTYDSATVDAQSLTIATEDSEVELFDAKCHADGGGLADKIDKDISDALAGNKNPTVGDIDNAVAGAINDNAGAINDAVGNNGGSTTPSSTTDKPANGKEGTDKPADGKEEGTDKPADKPANGKEEGTDKPANGKEEGTDKPADKPADGKEEGKPVDEHTLVTDLKSTDELSFPMVEEALANTDLPEAEQYAFLDFIGNLAKNPAVKGIADKFMPGAGTALELGSQLLGGLTGSKDKSSASGSTSGSTSGSETPSGSTGSAGSKSSPAPSPANPAGNATTAPAPKPSTSTEKEELGERKLDVDTDVDEFSFEVEGGSKVDCDVKVEGTKEKTTSSTTSKTTSKKPTTTPAAPAPVQSAPIADQGHKVDTGLETLAGKMRSICLSLTDNFYFVFKNTTLCSCGRVI